jgi:serine/threonine protein kinase
MATVYLARAPGNDSPVALKILHLHHVQLPQDPEHTVGAQHGSSIERFRREIEIHKRFRGPHIVRLLGSGSTAIGSANELESTPYLAMEYLPGGDLQARIGAGLNVARAVTVVRELCDALVEAHQMGVVHRDIKPSNVLFRKDGRAVLSDFGIARLTSASSLTSTGVMVGSPCYSSPEQIDGANIDHRSDIYNLGLILFEMLTGHRAFSGTNPLQVILAQVQGPIPQLPSGLSSLQPLLDRLLAKRRDERFADAVSLAQSLDSLLKRIGSDPDSANGAFSLTLTERTLEHCRRGLLEDLACDRLVLPTLPAAATRIRAALENPDNSADDIAQVVATEPALSAQLMRLANSVYYGGTPARNLHGAIMRLGTRAVQHIVMLLLVARVFDDSVTSQMRERLEIAWSRSLRVAFLAEALAQELGGCAPSEALLGGLVADIGTLPILAWAVDVPHVRDSVELLDALDRDLRPDLGRAMLERWDYPGEFLEVVTPADRTFTAATSRLTQIVCTAKILAPLVQGTQGPDAIALPAVLTLGSGEARSLRLSEDGFHRVLTQALEREALVDRGEHGLRRHGGEYTREPRRPLA